MNLQNPFQWTYFRRFAIGSTSKLRAESSSIFHQLWKANQRGKDDIDLTWILDIDSTFRIDKMLSRLRQIYSSSSYVFKTSSRRLGQDQYIRFGHTSSKCFQDFYQTKKLVLAFINQLLISRLHYWILGDWFIFESEQLWLVHLNLILTGAGIFFYQLATINL